MSLLEDVFLEDEANEAQELERIIEGDEYEERVDREPDSDENSEKEDEAEEDKRRVDPSSTKVKRVVKNPRVVLNPARLTGPRGIQVIPDHFKDFKFKGKGHEKEDLGLVLKKLEHWAYRLYPKFQFEDCLKKIETLGKKRPVMVHLHKIRSDQLITEEAVVQKDSSEDEAPTQQEDEFDKLLNQQIQLAKALDTPTADKRSPLMMPKATSSPSISDEQKERMMRNRKLAEERRLARLKVQNAAQNDLNVVDLTANVRGNPDTANGPVNIDLTHSDVIISEANVSNDVTKGANITNYVARKNRSNVIASSDDDDESTKTANKVRVDVHNNDEVIDVTEGYQKKDANDVIELGDEIIRKSHHRSQVIASSDDDDDERTNTANKVTVDVHNNDEVIDVTEGYQKKDANDVIELGNEIIRKSHHRSQVIASSDDDDDERAKTANKVTVDKYKNDEIIVPSEYQKKTNDNVTELDDGIVSKSHHILQVIDSSDDDDDDMAINEVDVCVNNEKKTKMDVIEINHDNLDDKSDDLETENDIVRQVDENSETGENIAIDDRFDDKNNEDDKIVETSTNYDDKIDDNELNDIEINNDEKSKGLNKDIERNTIFTGIIDSQNTELANDTMNSQVPEVLTSEKLEIMNDIENLKTNKEVTSNMETNTEGFDELMDVDFTEDF